MSTSLQYQKLKDLTFIEEQNNCPSFVWNGATYKFNPSITEFTRELDDGGYQLVRLLTATVRLYDVLTDTSGDETLNALFPNGTPEPQDVITYSLDNAKYRVQSIKPEKTGAYFRLIAHSTSKFK